MSEQTALGFDFGDSGDSCELAPFPVTPMTKKARDANDAKVVADAVELPHAKSTPNYRHIARTFMSEVALDEHLPWHLAPGDCYHCFSYGEIDQISYIRHLLKDQRAEYMMIATWAIDTAGVCDLFKWMDDGLIGRLDVWIGDYVRKRHDGKEYRNLLDGVTARGGKVCCFFNHAKIVVIFGERYDVVLESSANINWNPRSENAVITVSSELAEFYRDVFYKIHPHNKADIPEGWEPWRR